MKTLCDMVRDNAAERARNYRTEAEKDEKILLRLAQLLGLETYPERIEAYDISNLGHEHITAGMIVTDGTKFKKSDYRSFKIKTVAQGADDYQSMRETLARRFAHLEDEDGSFSNLPDLILLDGGRGHVSVVRELMRELDIYVPVFGMVKDDFHKTRALCTDSEEISIAKENALFVFIYKIQEEVHRYTVSKMSNAKSKTLTKSSLTKIQGIGDAKAKILLKAFGGYTGVKNAGYEELRATKGISERDARAVSEYFNNNK
jgi:excinuclease ABC subunit C